jgi:hypothetical protein
MAFRFRLHPTWSIALGVTALACVSHPPPQHDPFAQPASYGETFERSEAQTDGGLEGWLGEHKGLGQREALIETRHGQRVPAKYASVLPLLDYLAERHRGHYRTGTPESIPEIDRMMVAAHMSTRGAIFSNPNRDPPALLVGRAELAGADSLGRARALAALDHLGNMYFIGDPRHSLLSFAEDEAGIIVLVGRYQYGLHFSFEDGQFLLDECRYLPHHEPLHSLP